MKTFVAIESKTSLALISEVLKNYQASIELFDSSDELFNAIKADNTPDIVLISRETSHHAQILQLKSVTKVRSYYSNPLLLICDETSVDKIEQYVSAGITDIFKPQDLASLDDFINSYVSYQRRQQSLKDQTVLLVEDSISQSLAYKAGLQQLGIFVVVARSGQEALSYLKEVNIDLIVTDFVLEGDMTGLSLIRNLKRTTKWRDIPILVISAFKDESRYRELIRNGISEVMQKPLNMELFQLRCRNLIDNKRTFDLLIENQARLAHMAHIDSLTQLYNRGFLAEFIEKDLSESVRHNMPLSFIMLDLDDFKRINDNYGHDIGDKVLQRIAKIFKDHLRDHDLACRLGGEEFMLVLKNCGLKNALEKAETIRLKIEDLSDFDFTLTASLGVVCNDCQPSSYTALYKKSDNALYEAKRSGKNQTKKAI